MATDPLSLLFIGCFLFGLLFFIVTALLGNLGHSLSHTATHHFTTHVGSQAHLPPGAHAGAGTHAPAHAHGQTVHAPGGQNAHADNFSLLSFVNPTSVMLFLLGFGFFGYLFHNTGHFVALLTLVLAGISGIIIAALLLVMLGRLFGDSEGATVQDVSDRTGMLGKVSYAIQQNGLGEILYVSPGGMRKSIPARSVDGRRLERGQEVVVVKYERGVAEVDTWDHFINDEDLQAEASSDDEIAKLQALLNESDDTNTELVLRKDPQKE